MLLPAKHYGQQLRQQTFFFENPYLYNPAFAGFDKRAILYLNYRNQWMGIEGAPQTISAVFHTPAGDKSPFAYGGQVINDQEGVLSQSLVQGTFAYIVPLSVEKEHYIKMALSAGLGMSGFNNLDPESLVHLSETGLLESNSYLSGNFGLVYHNEVFDLGIAFPDIFQSPVASENSFNSDFGQLQNVMLTAGAKLPLGQAGLLYLKPYAVYYQNPSVSNYFEGGAALYYQNNLWVGGSYQQNLGTGIMLGINIKDKVKLAYAYYLGGQNLGRYSNGSQEIQVGIVLGRKREGLKRKPRLSRGLGEREPLIAESALKFNLFNRDKKKGDNTPASRLSGKRSTPANRNNPANRGTNPPKKSDNQDNNISAPRQNGETMEGIRVIGAEDSETNDGENKNQQEQEKEQRSKERSKPEGVDAASIDNPDKFARRVERGEKLISDSEALKDDFFNKNNAEKIQGDYIKLKDDNNSRKKKLSSLNKKPAKKHEKELIKGFYLTVGAYKSLREAEDALGKITSKGFFGQIGYVSDKKRYYVYLYETDNGDRAQKEAKRLEGQFSKIDILEVK